MNKRSQAQETPVTQSVNLTQSPSTCRETLNGRLRWERDTTIKYEGSRRTESGEKDNKKLCERRKRLETQRSDGFILFQDVYWEPSNEGVRYLIHPFTYISPFV